jgi:hypothetical protein
MAYEFASLTYVGVLLLVHCARCWPVWGNAPLDTVQVHCHIVPNLNAKCGAPG